MSVVTPDYLNLQKEIIEKQEAWKNEIIQDIVYDKNNLKNSKLSLVNQTQIAINPDKYMEFVEELSHYLGKGNTELTGELNKVMSLLNKETVERWIKEVIAFNEVYFNSFAEKHSIPEWIPHFLAEHAIRPYLRALSTVYENDLYDMDPEGSCPCCGEPIRLARLEGKVGKKVVHCPRCFANWSEKRSKCSHCGQDHNDGLHYLHIEDNKKLQIHICEDCNGYVKVIDTRGTLKQEIPAILDLNTIHLDILAQEKGYGLPKVNNIVN